MTGQAAPLGPSQRIAGAMAVLAAARPQPQSERLGGNANRVVRHRFDADTIELLADMNSPAWSKTDAISVAAQFSGLPVSAIRTKAAAISQIEQALADRAHLAAMRDHNGRAPPW